MYLKNILIVKNISTFHIQEQWNVEQEVNEVCYEVMAPGRDHYTFLGKLPTYPSPNPTFFPYYHLEQNVKLGEG